MRIETTRFGALEVAEEDVVEFSDGLFGFKDIGRYVVIDHRKDSPFKWLQAVDRPDLAFIVMNPHEFCSEYDFTVPEADSRALQAGDGTGLVVLVIVGIPEDPAEMTANLKGPILINPEKRTGRQIILPGDRYSARFRIIDEIRRMRGGTRGAE
jgi:flagellar assembly factor FliW